MSYAIAAVVVYLVFAIGLECGRKWEREVQDRRTRKRESS